MTELTDVPGAFGYGDSILVGDRVRLRGVRDDDLPTLAKWEMDPGRMTTLSSRVAPPSEAAAKERIAKWSANEEDNLGFAIETLDDPPVLIGNIGLWGARPKDRCATLGIALGREYIGRGYGTDAVRVIASYGFREMGLHRIQLSVAPFNPAGIRAYEKAGFVEEGRQRESVLHDGRWYDEVLMSILDHEWAARRLPSRYRGRHTSNRARARRRTDRHRPRQHPRHRKPRLSQTRWISWVGQQRLLPRVMGQISADRALRVHDGRVPEPHPHLLEHESRIPGSQGNFQPARWPPVPATAGTMCHHAGQIWSRRLPDAPLLLQLSTV